MTGFRTAAVLSMIVGDGRQRDPGGGGRDDGNVSIVRRRDPLGARPARAPQAGLRGLHGPPRPRAVHPPDRRRARRRRLQSSLQPGAAARRRVLLAHGRGPRAASVRRRRRATRSTRGSRCSSGSARAPTWACRWSSPTGRGSARSPRCRGAATPSPPPTSSCSSCSRAFSRPSSNESPTHETCAGSTTCFEIRPREWERSAGWPRRSRRAMTPASRSARRPARSWTRPVAFLLEPKGRDFSSTAMAGVTVQPVTIQPRGDGPGGRQGVHRQGGVLRRRRAQPPGAGRAAGRGDLGPLRRLRADPARRRGLRRADRDLAASAGRAARGGRAACCGWSRRRRRSRSSTRGLRARVAGAGADRSADRPGHAAGVRGGAAARDRARPPFGHAAVDRLARPRPHERVQHAARRGRGRPPGQGDRRARGATSCATWTRSPAWTASSSR